MKPNGMSVSQPLNFRQMQTAHQAVLLIRNEGMLVPSGVFHCKIKDSSDVTHQIYIGLYLNGLGRFGCLQLMCHAK